MEKEEILEMFKDRIFDVGEDRKAIFIRRNEIKSEENIRHLRRLSKLSGCIIYIIQEPEKLHYTFCYEISPRKLGFRRFYLPRHRFLYDLVMRWFGYEEEPSPSYV